MKWLWLRSWTNRSPCRNAKIAGQIITLQLDSLIRRWGKSPLWNRPLTGRYQGRNRQTNRTCRART
jgi:hypothetical protein